MRFIILALLTFSSAFAQEVKVEPTYIESLAEITPLSSVEKAEIMQRVTYVPVRNAMLTGPATFLTSSGLTITVSSESSVIATAAEGYDVRGPIDYMVNIPPASFAIPDNSTVYLVAEYNKNGTVNLTYTTIAIVYSATKPSDVSGTYWFDTVNYKMYKYSSSWENILAVPFGEAVSSGGNITSIFGYSYGAKYDSGWFQVAKPRSSNVKNHNIGTDQITVQAWGAADINGLRMSSLIYYANFASVEIGAGYAILPTRNTVDLVTYDNFRIGNVINGYEDISYARMLVKRAF